MIGGCYLNMGGAKAAEIKDPLGLVGIGTEPTDNASGLVAVSNGGHASGSIAGANGGSAWSSCTSLFGLCIVGGASASTAGTAEGTTVENFPLPPG